MKSIALLAALTLILVVAFSAVAVAADGGVHPSFGPLLFALGALVVLAKVGGLVAERWGQPSVLGELLVGIAVGNVLPFVLAGDGVNVVRSDPTLSFLAQIGVLVLLFGIGLEADLRALLRVGASSILVAMIGIVAPLLLGWAAAAWLFPGGPSLMHLFIGAALTATSVGVTARVLKDLAVTRSHEAQVILGAAIVDDVLGLIVLAVLVALIAASGGGTPPSLWTVGGIVLRAVVFLALTVGVGHRLSPLVLRLAARSGHPEIMLIIGLGICFTCAYLAELVGLADIVGAFAAGLMLDPHGEGVRAREQDATLDELLIPLSTLFVPLFFVLMGARVDVGSLASWAALGFGALLVVGAVLGKLTCGLGVIGSGTDRLAVGIGMIPRGEVGLIFAGIGSGTLLGGQPLLSEGQFAAIVLMVLVTTLVAPIGLRWAFGRHAATQAHRFYR
jgi:Kef-type K+ transport system membrane component KefB